MNESQNIYDNPVFFEGYRKLREREDNYNVLLEQPAMAELLPALEGKTVLDLGCGYGNNCRDFVVRGADRVVGIDVSHKMLEVAETENAMPQIEYRCMDMAGLSSLSEPFDFVYSSLAFHYIEDFGKLMSDINVLLNPEGMLLYSQEHPLTTATVDDGGHFNRDENGNHVSYTFSNYNESGKREASWFVNGVVKYHRPMGEILTTTARSGFVIDTVCEPTPKPWAVEKNPALAKEWLKPCFLIVRARKA